MGLAGCRRVHEGGAEPLLSGEELNWSLDALQLVLPPFAPDQVEPGPFVDGSGHQDFARSGSGLRSWLLSQSAKSARALG